MPLYFKAPVRAMKQIVERAKVTDVFLSAERTWGTPSSTSVTKAPGAWNHIAVMPPIGLLHRLDPLLTSEQTVAAKHEEHGMLCRALAEFPLLDVEQAVTLLSTESLYRSERCLGVATWFRDLHVALASTKNKRLHENLIWLAVAKAPPGWCHVRSGMIGTLLEDIASGKPMADVARAFAAKMDPTKYLRPQAAPSAGNIAAAEKIVSALGIERSLARRFAKLEDVEKLWTPVPAASVKPVEGGVFAHLMPKGFNTPPDGVTAAVTMTWVKFAATMLPDATRIELLVPHGNAPFMAMVTAVDPEAPPILQWDSPEKRNPVSVYVYHYGSPALQWNLQPGSYVEVTAVALTPSMWNGNVPGNQNKNALFLLAGARDTAHKQGGGFFPETLRSELHAVRKTLERHVATAAIADRDEATACGITFAGQTFRVTTRSGMKVMVKIDRWD